MAFIWNGVSALCAVGALIISIAAFRRSGRAREAGAEWAAQRAIDGIVRDYVNGLKRGRPDRPGPGRGTFSSGYASLRGQAELAEKIHEHARDLRPRARARVLDALRDLVGEKTVADAEVGIEPAGPIGAIGDGPVASVDRFEDVERHILMNYHDGAGCETKTRVHCERDHYPQVQREYGKLGLLWLTKHHPHYQHFEERYAAAVGCMEQLVRRR